MRVCLTCDGDDFVEEAGRRICAICGMVVEEGASAQESIAHRAGKRLRDELRLIPHGAPPEGFTGWDSERACWIDAEGKTRQLGAVRRRPEVLPEFGPPPADDLRPWNEWFDAMVHRERGHNDNTKIREMTADEALQQAEADGLKLARSATNSTGFVSVNGAHRKNYQAFRQLPAYFCHITMAPSPEEAALHVARFRAYPLGEEAAGARLLSRRRAAQEQRREEQRKKAAEMKAAREKEMAAQREAALEARLRRQAEAKAAEDARRAKALMLERAREEEQARAKAAREELARAKAASKAAAKAATKAAAQTAKEELAARQKQAAEMQKELLRQSQQRLLREAAERQRGAAAAAASTTTPPADEMRDDEFSSQPVEALVQRALAASQPGGCPYKCFGLLPGAPSDKVRKRYLALALRLHPDKLQHPMASEAFAAVERAHSRLCTLG
eukprot:6186848-Prymnesium_polylepis.1